MTTIMIPSSLLLSYFGTTRRELQRLTNDEISEANPELSWHRSRIVQAQLTVLDDVISEWQRHSNHGDLPIAREAVQSVLRQIGLGDFSCVLFEGNNESCALEPTPSTGLRSRHSSSPRGSSRGDDEESEQGVLEDREQEQQLLLTEEVEKTNEVARQAFARSVLIVQWRLHRQQLPQSQSGREFRGDNDSIDEKSLLEYCGLMIAAVLLPEIQRYLQNGTMDFIHSDQSTGSHHRDYLCDGSIEDRLFHIQKLYWQALGWNADYANDQLKCLLSGENTESSIFEQIMNNPKGVDTLTKYASAMTVAVMSNIEDRTNQSNDDGTTRVVSVSYSEKIISVPIDSGDATSHSLAAPTRQGMDERDLVKRASILQQQLWSEFQSLPPHEKSTTLEKARKTHEDFQEKVANTPPGRDRVLLMQRMDGEMQKLLVIYKLWCVQRRSDAEKV